MAGGQHEAIAVQPVRVRGVEPQEAVKSVLITGTIAMAVPGWPEFAFWTASIDSVRMVLMHRSSRLGAVSRSLIGAAILIGSGLLAN